ncbi:MAG: NeuD/PglB/VioB family sugar acetyltransferase [Propionibacteriales bacterium]|nr:NeuD/PglB/VioB family sugar acetyltransferase [Propionibacteriales bacterium]
MTTELVVVGAGGFGRQTLDVIEAIVSASASPIYEVRGVLDDRPSEVNLQRLAARGYRWLGSISDALAGEPGHYALAVGHPAIRQQLAAQFDAHGWLPATLVHPTVILGSVGTIGEGSIICGGVQLSTNLRLGRHVHINPNATVGHDADLADFVSVNPGAIISGEVGIGTRVLVGAGAVVLQGLSVGPDVTIGACACVTHDVPPGVTVVGVPGRWS